MAFFRSELTAWPSSSKAIITAAAPYLRTSFAFLIKSASPSFKLMEFTMAFPCKTFNPASRASHFEESIMIGSREISGSDTI